MAIRTRQGVLPIRMGELEELKSQKLETWTDKQRTLLNMWVMRRETVVEVKVLVWWSWDMVLGQVVLELGFLSHGWG